MSADDAATAGPGPADDGRDDRASAQVRQTLDTLGRKLLGLESGLRKLQDPRGRVFVAGRDGATGFAEKVPNEAGDDLNGYTDGRSVSNGDPGGLIDLLTDETAVLEFQVGTNVARVAIGGTGGTPGTLTFRIDDYTARPGCYKAFLQVQNEDDDGNRIPIDVGVGTAMSRAALGEDGAEIRVFNLLELGSSGWDIDTSLLNQCYFTGSYYGTCVDGSDTFALYVMDDFQDKDCVEPS